MKKAYKITWTIITGILLIVVFVSAMVKPLESSNYYIDSINGNDDNDGRTPGTAWKSLDKVNSTIFKHGDSVLFKANCSWTGQLSPKGSGSNEKQITLGMYGYNSVSRSIRNKPHFEGNGAYPTELCL